MQEGIIRQSQNNWVVISDGIELPIHVDHSMWLKMFGHDGMKVCFETAIFESVTKAILKACGPDTHEYIQD